MKKLLPIGSVVLLTGGTKEVMITGYKSKASEDSEVMDYNGCIFPEGFMDNRFLLFNHSQIDQTLFVGYDNEEFEELNDKINMNVSSGFMNDAPQSNGLDVAKAGRRRTAPKHPMSKNDMRRKYGINKVSGNDPDAEVIGGHYE